MTPNLVIAALGPFAELLGIVVLVGAFTLLRSQSDRRPYFKSWEESWVMLAVGLTGGVIYERLVDPSSVLYPGGPFSTWFFATVYITFRLLGVALLLNGTSLFVRGMRSVWRVRLAIAAGVGVTFAVDTQHTPIGALTIWYGPLAVLAYGGALVLVGGLPRSRRSPGSRIATLALAGLALLTVGLIAFYAAQRMDPALTGRPWAVRFARYGFYGDLLLQLALAYGMVRLLFEDARRETIDDRAHLVLLQDRVRRDELWDAQTNLLSRRAYESSVALDFANASFGTVVRLLLRNVDAVVNKHGAGVGQALFAHFAGVISSEVRTHDRVFRWGERELLVVLPRAVPDVAKARMERMIARAAPLALPGASDPVHVEAEVAVAGFTGREDLPDAVRTAGTSTA